MAERVSRPNIDLKVVMDQSVFVRQAIKGLVQEGVTGGAFCVLVILLFLGQWKMTAIAGMTLPLSVLVSLMCLYATGNTINVMTLAGLTLAIGPMVDSAVICLENTERHLGMGASPEEAAFLGASQVALPELVSTICTLLVLWPLALTSELGMFLFKPMAMARHLLHDRRLHAVADPGAGLLRRLAEGPSRPCGTGPRGTRARKGAGEGETFEIEEDRRGAAAAGSCDGPGPGGMSGIDAFFGGYVRHPRLDARASRRRRGDGRGPAGRVAGLHLPGPAPATSTPTSTRAPSR